MALIKRPKIKTPTLKSLRPALDPILNPVLRRGRKSSQPDDFGTQGQPIDRSHPFYFGFIATAGVLTCLTFFKALGSASQVFVLIIISLFFAAGLNPAVLFFQRRGLTRGLSVASVVSVVLLFVALFLWIAIPPIIDQVNSLISNAPQLIGNLKNNSVIASLNEHYAFIDTLQKKVDENIQNGQIAIGAFGGVIGVGKAFISGTFAFLTILVLTLYFLSSLPKVTQIAYRFAPASRRERISKISDAIIGRIGAFVGGQVTVSAIAGIVMLIVALVLKLDYSFALGMTVFICGLIPMIGHLLGITIYTIVALTNSPTTALFAFLAYVIYQQIENYIIMPRIMSKSLSVPGLVTIIAALLGTSLLGLIGALLAVPIAAAILLIVEEVVFPRTDNS